MQKNKIDELEEVAKQGVESTLSSNPLTPTIIICSNKGTEVIGVVGDGPNARTYTLAGITQLLTDRNADAYALVTEGYATKFVEAAKKVGGRVRDLPPEDRYDIASIVLMERGQIPKLVASVIDADSNGVRSLRKWETMDSAKGAYVITEW